jgi:hypothetical protein
MLIEPAKCPTRFETPASRLARCAVLALVLVCDAAAQSPGAASLRPNLESNVERPLRYRADARDFVIQNGAETFNRPLYGRNTAFRVDGGDRPEFVMYLPGRGGNLRLGLRSGAQSKWLIDAAQTTTRYRPGELLYEIRDPLLGVRGVLQIQLLAMHETDGLVLRFAYQSGGYPQPRIELVAAFGGVNGQRGVRDGDIGTERVPISQWFQLAPEFCRDNSIMLERHGFELRSPVARIAGVLPREAVLTVGDAKRWSNLDELLVPAVVAPAEPVVVARMPLLTGKVRYLALQRIAQEAAVAAELDTYRDVSAGTVSAPPPDQFIPRYKVDQLPQVFARTREHFRALRERVWVNTPDPYVDAAVGALNVAADALWDEGQQVVMHGAIAWRARLLGWRGPYVMDALGWHERARKHFEYWATRQNTSPVPAVLPPAEEATHLARNPAALHGNGDLSNSHYDMNLVYIDALFRHLLWTGDVGFARAHWPMIERHLAWERRLFRREFGPRKLPLYEAYAAIWASDDLQYHGGGVTHASAYNWWHNMMAARVAKWLGEDAAPYELEATLIRQAMMEFLWLPEQGMFAEYRDYLGLKRAHPSAALWSFYHPLDAPGLVGPGEALLMGRYVKSRLPRLPVRGPGVPGDDLHLYATSNWMPYTWSINNVVMGENLHAALGFWQAGDPGEAFTLFRSALMASMFMGISPGNVGSMNYLDVYRRESQRDFADGAGVLSRAFIEGLFGIRPDALAGTLGIEPGWPDRWTFAALRAPHVSLDFRREERLDRYVIEPAGSGNSSTPFQRVRMRLRMQGESALVRANGKELLSLISQDEQGNQWLTFSLPATRRLEVFVEWVRWSPLPPVVASERPQAKAAPPEPAAGVIDEPGTRYVPVDLAPFFNDRVTEIFRAGKYLSPRSPFVSLAMPSQGIGAWAGHVNATAEIDDGGLRRAAAAGGGRLTMPDGVTFATPGAPDVRNIIFTSQWDNYPRSVRIPLQGRARRLHLLMAGSTNHMQSQFDNGEVVVEYQDGTRERLPLHNPSNWWPIDQDYFIDDFQFRVAASVPPRVDLKTGRVRMPHESTLKGHGGVVPGGAATVLTLPLREDRELRALTVSALANEVVIGLMSATLVR